MWLEMIVAGAMVVALTFFALLGGADYGGGVWDLLAFGPRAKAQRELISSAIGPVWEANHVWMILVVVLLFTGFPAAFAAIATALHIPLTLLLIGIVLRGAAFTFRSYDSQQDGVQRRWGYLFSTSSVMTPVWLGVVVGALSSGAIRVEGGVVTTGFFTWVAPFPFAVGFFALALFAFLAAVYLCLEAREGPLKEDFRLRALFSGAAVGAMALLVFLLSSSGAPNVRTGLSQSAFALPLHAATALSACGAFAALWTRKFFAARIFAALQVSLILWGWALAQYPCLVEPDITIASAAAPPATLRFLLIALGGGALLLFPSLYYLLRVFKSSRSTPQEEH